MLAGLEKCTFDSPVCIDRFLFPSEQLLILDEFIESLLQPETFAVAGASDTPSAVAASSACFLRFNACTSLTLAARCHFGLEPSSHRMYQFP
jgi:hypothetical protein